jgi:hypothetical protein
MVAVEILHLQVVLLSNARLELTCGLNEISLSVVVKGLQLLDDFQLVFYDFVLLVNLGLETANLHFFLFGF